MPAHIAEAAARTGRLRNPLFAVVHVGGCRLCSQDSFSSDPFSLETKLSLPQSLQLNPPPPFLTGGKQYKITTNDIIVTNRLKAELGARIRLEKVGLFC